MLWWLVTQLGQVLAATRLGQLILRRPPHDEGLILSGIIGGLIVHGFLLFAVLLYNASGLAALTVGTIGIGFQLVLICIGTGALFSSRFGEDPEKRQARGSDKGPLFQPAAPGGETR